MINVSYSPGNMARDLIQGVLQTAVVGFNDTFAAILNGTGTHLPVLTFDFSAPVTQNFMIGRVAPGDMEESTPMSYPLCNLYVIQARNENQQKFQKFSGTVDIGLTFWLQDITSQYTGNLEIYADCIEATLIEMFNSADISEGGVSYAGQIAVQRGQLLANQDGWILSVPSVLTLIVNV